MKINFKFFQGEIGAKNLFVLCQEALFYVLFKFCKCVWMSALRIGEDPEPKHQIIKGSLKLGQVLPARYKTAFKNSI